MVNLESSEVGLLKTMVLVYNLQEPYGDTQAGKDQLESFRLTLSSTFWIGKVTVDGSGNQP